MFKIVLLICLALSASAHIGAFCDGCFGGARGDLDAELAVPLNSNSGDQSQWFFRGLDPSSASGTTIITPGQDLTLSLACSKHNDEDSSGQACGDSSSGSLHHRADGSTSGCGIGISYKPFEDIQPSDLKIITVLHNCPLSPRTHKFKMPSNMPAGNATAAFFWIPPVEAAANEMYMTGIRVNIAGKTTGTISGAKSAMYWGVSGFGTDGTRPRYEDLPDGAQKFSVSGGTPTTTASLATSTSPGRTTTFKAASSTRISSAAIPVKAIKTKAAAVVIDARCAADSSSSANARVKAKKRGARHGRRRRTHHRVASA